MKRVFIAYADENMAYSLKRIGKQASNLEVFDEVILWTPQMLPNWIKQSPLMQYSYGGGFGHGNHVLYTRLCKNMMKKLLYVMLMQVVR